MSVSAVEHVRRALAARQFDGHDPKDLSDAVELAEGVELPQAMVKTGAGLLYWVGFGDVDYDAEAQTRYVATETVRLVVTAPRRDGERSSAVADRVSRWFVAALAARPVSADGILLARAAALSLVEEVRTDRGGRAILTGSAVVSLEYDY